MINARGYESQVWILGEEGPLNDLAATLNVPILNFNINIRKSILFSFFQLFKLGINLRKSRFDIIHAFLPKAVILTLPTARFFTPSTKRIAGIRGSLQKRGHFIDFLYGQILNDSWRIICNSTYLKKHLKNEFDVDSGKIYVIHNGVASIDIRNKSRNEIPVGVVIANFHPYKGHLMLLRVLSRIEDEYRIILFGSGALKGAILKDIQKLNLTNKVSISSSNINSLEFARNADFAIHPSESEGLSNAILEEMSAGLPVVAFNIGGNSELITSGLNGFLIEPFNLLELQSKIEELIRNNELRKVMSLAAVGKSKDFSWEVHIEQLFEVYEIHT